MGESGVSHNRCMETYCGPEAFSEVEMGNIRDFVTTLDPVPVLGHCFHSYSQLWPSMPATPFSKSTAPSLTQSTQLTFTLLLEPLTTGTKAFWAPGLHLPPNCVTPAPMGLSCQRSKSSQAGRRCGPALRSSSTES